MKEEIEASQPFISDLQDIQLVKHEFSDSKFERCFEELQKRYTKIRRLRRDGNCFYRAFLFQVFEHFIVDKNDTENYEKMLKVLEGSK